MHFLNGFAHRSWTLDTLIVLISSTPFLKGGALVILLWWAWFLPGADAGGRREKLVCTIVVSTIALALARGLAVTLPFRARPFHNPTVHIRLAYSLNPDSLINWSSFPSDHATIFFAFATGLLFVSRRLGAIALSWVVFVICLPRIYLGIHYPTDILAGAAIGSSLMIAAMLPPVTSAVARPALRWAAVSPNSFYACFFAYTFQIAQNFNGLRQMSVFTFHIALNAVARLHPAHIVSVLHNL